MDKLEGIHTLEDLDAALGDITEEEKKLISEINLDTDVEIDEEFTQRVIDLIVKKIKERENNSNEVLV